MNEEIIKIKEVGRFGMVISEWKDKQVGRSIMWAISLFAVSLIINYFAGTYATLCAGGAVNDIILDNIPVFDVDGIFIYGITAFFILVAILIFLKPKKAPFIIKSLSLFIMVRAVFVCLTHIGPVPEAVSISPDSIVNLFTFPGDLFFSAHTGFPFLMALIYWRDKYIRFIFLTFTFVLGLGVLLGHLHYSIDVFSAFFITYGILQIAKYIFVKDYASGNFLT